MHKLLSAFLAAALLAACAGPAQSYQATGLPGDVTDLWLTEGTDGAGTVLIVAQGGPSDQIDFERDGRTTLRYLPDFETYEVAYVHQSQTYNPALFDLGEAFSMTMAREEAVTTVDMLEAAIDYYKDRDRTVIVTGHSYGAFIVANYLATREARGDQYIITSGRLDVNEEMVADHRRGWTSQFEEDGTSYIAIDGPDLADRSPSEVNGYYVRNRLKAAFGEPRYSERLADADLSDVHFFYASNDRNVGSLSEAEVAFLQAHGASVYETTTGHYETRYRFIDAVAEGRLTLASPHRE